MANITASMQELKAFRLSQEVVNALEKLKKEYKTGSDSEAIRKAILDCDQALTNKENEYKRLIENKDNEIKALYTKIGELQSELSKPILLRLFSKK